MPPVCQESSTNGDWPPQGTLTEAEAGRNTVFRRASNKVLSGREVGPKGLDDFFWLNLVPMQHPGLLLAVALWFCLEEPLLFHSQSMQFQGEIPILASVVRMWPRTGPWSNAFFCLQ